MEMKKYRVEFLRVMLANGEIKVIELDAVSEDAAKEAAIGRMYKMGFGHCSLNFCQATEIK